MKKNLTPSLLVVLLTSGCFSVETFAMDADVFEHAGRPSLPSSVNYHPTEITDHLSSSLKVSNIFLQEEINTSWMPSWVDKKVIVGTCIAIGGAAVLGGLYYRYWYQPWKESVDFEQLIKENITAPCEKLIINEINTNTPKTAADLRKKFKKINDRIHGIDFNSEKFSENLAHLIALFNNSDDELCVKIHEGLSNIENKSRGKDLKNEFFKYLQKYLSSFSEKPKCNSSGFSATLIGMIVGTSDLEEARENEQERLCELSEINVYSKHTLLIDEDLTAPCTNVCFLAPHWFVMNKQTISLKGNDGVHYGDRAQDGVGYKSDGKTGEDGKDGCHGRPGKSAGHFYGQGERFSDLMLSSPDARNITSLTINVSGGKGGNGQNAGNGANGLSKAEGDKSKVENRNDDCLISSIVIGEESTLGGSMNKVKIFFSPFANKTTKNTYESGESGGQGGDAGRGGKGGYSGRKGSVRIENTKEKKVEIIPTKKEIEEDGEDGIHGIPGNGGTYCIYRRTFFLIEYPNNRYLEGAGCTVLFLGGWKLLGFQWAATITPSFFIAKKICSYLAGKINSHWEHPIEIINTPIPGYHATEHYALGMVRNEPRPPINIKEKRREYEKFLKSGD